MSTAPEEPGDARTLAAAAEHVSDSAGALAGQIAALREELAAEREQRRTEVAAERRRGRRNSLGLVFMAMGLVLDIVLTISIVVIASDQYITASEQARTRVRVLCPLYSLLLASVDPAKRDALPPAQQTVYDHTVQVIQDGYRTLGCQPALPDVISSGTSSTR